MKIINSKDKKALFKEVLNRSQFDLNRVNEAVFEIINKVEKEGDKALIDFTLQFDKVLIDKLEVSKEEIDNAYNSVDKELIMSLEACYASIKENWSNG